jgi:Sigma-70, region 4
LAGKTVQRPLGKLTREELASFEEYPEWAERPRYRSECEGDARPCPHVTCRHHLYLEVLPSGQVKYNFPGLEVWELAHTCSLDVADGGPRTLEEVAELFNLTRERVRQLEVRALVKLRGSVDQLARGSGE